MTISPCRSAKWPRRRAPALRAEDVGPADVEQRARAPRAHPGATPVGRGRDARAGPTPIPLLTPEPGDRPSERWGRRGRRSEERDVRGPDDRRTRTRRAGPSRRRPPARASATTSSPAIARRSRSGRLPPRGRRRSSARRSRPTPTRARRAPAARARSPAGVGRRRHQRRALGDREHEDEVEEQLERRDALLLAERRGAGAGGGDLVRSSRVTSSQPTSYAPHACGTVPRPGGASCRTRSSRART